MMWAWGLAGAFVYATPNLILQLWADGATPSRRLRAAAEFGAALATGAIFSAGLSSSLAGFLKDGVTVNGLKFAVSINAHAVALTVGWSSNYLWPIVLRRLGSGIEKIEIGGKAA